jgi:hypothetical protein
MPSATEARHQKLQGESQRKFWNKFRLKLWIDLDDYACWDIRGPRNVLSAAVGCGDPKIFDVILDREPDINYEDTLYGTPIFASVPGQDDRAGKTDLSMALKLLSQGADIWAGTNGRSALNLRDDILSSVVCCMFENKWGLPENINKQDSAFGRTLLHWAVLKGAADLVDMLLSHGASVGVQDHDGCTPLHYTFGECNLSIAHALVVKGAILNIEDNNGMSPLKLARLKDSEGHEGQLRDRRNLAAATFLVHLKTIDRPCEGSEIQDAYDAAIGFDSWEFQKRKARRMEIEEGEAFSDAECAPTLDSSESSGVELSLLFLKLSE